MKTSKKCLSFRFFASLTVKLFLAALFLIMLQKSGESFIMRNRSILVSAGFGILLFTVLLDYFFLLRPYKRLCSAETDAISSSRFEDLTNLPFTFSPCGPALAESLRDFVQAQKTAELDRKQSEYLALQNQINPHFLYNTLDAIRSDAMKADVWEIADLIEALSSFFAYTISNMDTYASIKEELSHVNEYYMIQEYRFKDRIRLEIQNSEDVDLEGLYVPRLLLQPLVENAISHGLEVQQRQGTVTISFSETEKDLIIHVADNGAGIEEESLRELNRRLEQPYNLPDRPRKKRGGIALTNVNHRIRMLSGEDYGLHIYSIPGSGTVVTARLPKIDREHADEKRISSN